MMHSTLSAQRPFAAPTPLLAAVTLAAVTLSASFAATAAPAAAPAAAAASAAASPAPAAAGPASETDRQDYSAAERLLFMTPQFGGLKPPQTLRYAFHKAGAFEPGYDDKVAVILTPQADGGCCAARSEFLSAERRLVMPDVPAADSNPVILYFLEHDVREMQRLTKGSQNHFRQRIRMAVYNAATVSDVSVRWRGQTVKAKEIRFTPYLDDPNRPKFEKFVRKEYRFVLSDAVPGGVYGIRTRIGSEDAAAAPLIVEELYAEGAEPEAANALR